jgi:hypothetical protein
LRGLLLSLSALVGCGGAAAPPEPAATHTVYLSFSRGDEGVTLGARDDATSNVSELCEAPELAAWPGLAECGDRAACAAIIRELVADLFAAYDVGFTLERPRGARSYAMVMVAPFEASCSFGRLGVAATDCDDRNPASLAFVFGCASSAVECAALIAHEAAHTFGLVHAASSVDLMTLAPAAGLEFGDVASPALEQECGTSQQSSHQALLQALGPAGGS